MKQLRWWCLVWTVLATPIFGAPGPFDLVKDNPDLPRVLLIGDSISIGYTVPVREQLRGKANVHRIPVNGAYSSFGLANARSWIGTGKWDVIHFNFGIWDTHMLDSKGKIIGSKDERPGSGQIRATIPEYEKNLDGIIDVLQETGAKLIFATTTPLMCRRGSRFEDVARYNRAAVELMEQRRVPIDDLYSLVIPHITQIQQDDGCHFTAYGSDLLGRQVTRAVLAALQDGRLKTLAPAQTGEQQVAGRRVSRFEHDCVAEWGYPETNSLRQYFYIIEPRTEKAGLPLIVFLHSAGGDAEKEMPRLATNVAVAGDDFTGLVLNSGKDSEWWWGAHEIKAHPDRYTNSPTPVESRVLATVEWVVQKCGVDRNRVYLQGISMGGSGALGIGLTHGHVFAAVRAGVPATTFHALYRLTNSMVFKKSILRNEIPPALVYFSQQDSWAEEMEPWLGLARREKMFVLAAWGPWGHMNHYEMVHPAAAEFPWLTLRKDQAYPSFQNVSSDNQYPGYKGPGPDQEGQYSAFFRWSVQRDESNHFAMELRLVRGEEMSHPAAVPAEVLTNVTLRRLQHLHIKLGKSYLWELQREGKTISSGRIQPGEDGLLTIPQVKLSREPALLTMSEENE